MSSQILAEKRGLSLFSFPGAGGPEKPPEIVRDHDYYRFPIKQSCREYSPVNFGGISGGGLWQVPIETDNKGKFKPKFPLLSGVVFYQEPLGDEGFALKCHGRSSVYGIAYEAIATGQP